MNNTAGPGNKNKNRFLVYASSLLPVIALLWFASSTSSCSVYRFKDVSIPDSIKTVKINYLENKARYINPQLSPQLSDKLRQKIVNQTRLTQTNDQADWEISGYISDYSVTTAAISAQQNATDRLNVGVHITIYDRLANKTQEYDITRSFDYSASQTLEQVQAARSDEIISNLTDEIFNKLFSNW